MPKNYPMDLGKEPGEMSVPVEVDSDKSEKYYPTVYLEGKEFKDLPDEGVMKVKFKVCSRVVSECEGKKRVSVDVELKEILDLEGEKEEGDDEMDAASILDAIKDSIE